MFGSAAKTPFGTGTGFGTGTTAFGTQAATASPFGQTTLGGFGAKVTQSSAFGSTFGQPTNTTSTLFGGVTNNTGSGLFAGNATGSLFGQSAGTQSTSGFNSFGQPNTATTGFGAATSSAGSSIFQNPGTTTFGTGTSTGFGTGTLFSGGTTQTGTKLFGTPQQQQQGSFFGTATLTGTTNAGTPVKFNPVPGTDSMVKNGITQQVSVKHQCITIMKEYDAKSFEELRFEDYTVGRKTGPSGATATAGTGLFPGSTTTANSSLFGSSTGSTGFGTSAFGQKSGTTGFGTASAFGTPSTNLFGQQQQQGTNLFGQKTTGIFGGTTPAAGTTGFGTTGFGTGSTGLFGASSAGQTSGLFGTTTTSAGTGLFGTGSLGQTSGTTGLFGQPAFGQTQTQQGGLFGNKAVAGTAGSLFGATQSKAATGAFNFGAGTGQLTTTPFGGIAGTTGSLFQNKFGTGTTGLGAGTSLFGNTGTTGFGTTGFTGLGTTGAFSGLGQQTIGLGLGAASTLGNQNALALAQQQQQLQQQVLALASSPFGDSPLFRNSLTEKQKSERASGVSTSTANKLSSTPSHYKVSPRSTTRIKPRPINNYTMNKSKLFDGLEDESGLSPDTFVPRKSVKKLVIRSKQPAVENSLSSHASTTNMRLNSPEQNQVLPMSTTPHLDVTTTNDRPVASSRTSGSQPKSLDGSISDSSFADNVSPIGVRYARRERLDDTISDLNVRPSARSGTREVTAVSPPVNNDDNDDGVDSPVRAPEPCGIILQRPDYYTVPSTDELNRMVDANGDVLVDDFIVGRLDYGEAKFLGRTNVARLNLDDIVFFRRREIEVYPDSYPNKPPVGEELNKTTEVTLHKVWPNDKTSHKAISSPERLKLLDWQERVKSATSKLGATFLSYKQETGTWMFTVDHFTRYGMHEALGDENAVKKLKRLPVQSEVKDRTQEMEREKMDILKKLKEQEEKSEAFESFMKQKQKAALTVQDQDSDMVEINQETFPEEVLSDDDSMEESPASHQLATSLGMNAHRMQVMKASFFAEEEQVRLPSSRKEKSSLEKSLLSGTFTESSPLYRPHRFSSVVSQGPLLSPKVHGTADTTLYTSLSSQSLSGSPKIGALTPKHPLAYEVPMAAPCSPMMLPSAIGSAFDVGVKVVGACRQPSLVPKEDSLIHTKENLIADAGLMLGRSFRVGWGPGFVLVHSGNPVGQKTHKALLTTHSTSLGRDLLIPKSKPSVEADEGNVAFGVTVEKFNVLPQVKPDGDVMLAQHLPGLEVELEHCRMTDEDDCPLFDASPGTESLQSHVHAARKARDALGPGQLQDITEQMCLVWDLVGALWAPLLDSEDALESEAMETYDRESYQHHISRKEALSRWLMKAARKQVKREVDQANLQEKDGYLDVICSHLTGKQISVACSVAQQNGDYRLSLLLSQVTGSTVPRRLLQAQLSDWEKLKADKFISPRRMKIFALLAGSMVWHTLHNKVNVCEGLDWKRALAVHLWYYCSPTSPIQDTLVSYEDAFKGRSSHGRYSSEPWPAYMVNDNEEADAEEGECSRVVIRDTCYHLLKLYGKRSHRLERLLSPATSTPHHLDYRLSWHLAQALRSLNYTHLSQDHTGALHDSFAAQLEAVGLWDWAAFVLLHIHDTSRREHAVRSLLCRHCRLSLDEEYIKKETFMKERLHIPEEWIHEAKALRARYEGRSHEEAVHLLKSGRWNLGHRVILDSLASEAIINEEYDSLKALLEELEPRERNSTVKNWATGGQVFLDYLLLREMFQEIVQGSRAATRYELEQIHMEAASLCNRINHTSDKTAKDRLCQYDMAKMCANFLKITSAELADRDTDQGAPLPSQLLVHHVTNLPMPEDCSLAELRELTANYITEITSMVLV